MSTAALPVVLGIAVLPALLGTQEAIRQSQSKSRREEHRARRCNLLVSCVGGGQQSRQLLHDKLVVLRDSKLYVGVDDGHGQDASQDASAASAAFASAPGEGSKDYPFAGYFLPYPDTSYEGLVTTISDDPPILNWIYVDQNTHEVKYGLRADSQGHLTGPFDCTRQDRRLTLEGWEGFVVVEESHGVWALYFDRTDNGLHSKVPPGTKVLEVELNRHERKEKKPAAQSIADADCAAGESHGHATPS